MRWYLKCSVDRSRRYLEDLLQGSMEIPCKLLSSIKSNIDCEKLKKLVLAFLSKTRDQKAECEIVGPMVTAVRILLKQMKLVKDLNGLKGTVPLFRIIVMSL